METNPSSERPDPDEPKDPSRRSWGKLAIGWGLVAGTMGTGWLMLQSWLPWIGRGEDGRWRLGTLDRFPEGSVTLLRRANAVVVHDEGGLHALSAICTHQRCTVHDSPARRELTCPCHGAAYTYDGQVLRGPTQTPLAWLDLREENGELVLDPKRRVAPGSGSRRPG